MAGRTLGWSKYSNPKNQKVDAQKSGEPGNPLTNGILMIEQ